jgi:hypothetical protein
MIIELGLVRAHELEARFCGGSVVWHTLVAAPVSHIADVWTNLSTASSDSV